MDNIIGLTVCGPVCIIGIVLAVIGVVALLKVNRGKQKAEMSADWPTALGQITSARVEEAPRTRSDDDVFYHAVVDYSYVVEDQAYTGQQAVSRSANLAGLAKRALAHYPVGMEVSVAYNPARPAQSRLVVQ